MCLGLVVSPVVEVHVTSVCVCPQVFGDGMQIQMYAPPRIKIDPSIAVILLISVVTVALGGYWSGACER